MKQLTIEQKAQRYDETLEKGKKILGNCNISEDSNLIEALECLFPELKESK